MVLKTRGAKKLPKTYTDSLSIAGLQNPRTLKYLIKKVTWCDDPVYVPSVKLNDLPVNVLWPIHKEALSTRVEVDLISSIATQQSWWFVRFISYHENVLDYTLFVRFRSKWAHNEYLFVKTNSWKEKDPQYLIKINSLDPYPISVPITGLKAITQLIDQGAKAAPLFINHACPKVRSFIKDMLKYPC